MPVLDPSLFKSTLRDELRAAWLKLHAEHAPDGLYGFGVFTTDSASYLRVAAFAEKTLAQAVAKHVDDFRDGGRCANLRKSALEMGGRPDDPALQRACLRWSPADSPLHEVGSGLLPRSDAIVQALEFEGRRDGEASGDPGGDEIGDDEDDDCDSDSDDDYPPDPEVEKVFEIILHVLKELDGEGLFGTGAEREQRVLSIWEGDQSNLDRYAFAKALNPAAVAARFGREMNEGLRAYYHLYMGPDDIPQDDVFD